MDGQIFRINRIEGEYAYISPINGGEEVFIAVALLPLGIDVGMLVVCENFSFTIYEGWVKNDIVDVKKVYIKLIEKVIISSRINLLVCKVV